MLRRILRIDPFRDAAIGVPQVLCDFLHLAPAFGHPNGCRVAQDVGRHELQFRALCRRPDALFHRTDLLPGPLDHVLADRGLAGFLTGQRQGDAVTVLLTSLLAEYWQQIAGAVLALIGAAGLYLKGRSDAKTKAKLEDITNANAIRKQGADARAGADTDRLRDDGWKRD